MKNCISIDDAILKPGLAIASASLLGGRMIGDLLVVRIRELYASSGEQLVK